MLKLEADYGFLIGPPPPSMVAEAASANEAERFEEVTRILAADENLPYDVVGVNWKMSSDNIKKSSIGFYAPLLWIPFFALLSATFQKEPWRPNPRRVPRCVNPPAIMLQEFVDHMIAVIKESMKTFTYESLNNAVRLINGISALLLTITRESQHVRRHQCLGT